jgi:5-methylcytosine-specific restriction protein A
VCVLALDPDYEGVGLEAGGKLEKAIWDEFSRDRQRLAAVAAAIRAGYLEVEPSLPPEVEEELAFPEGKVLYRLHRLRERSPGLVRRAKERALHEDGKLACAGCSFVFAEVYGEVGRGFIEAHHLAPLGELAGERRSRLSDLALVCANCHRMLHRKRPWLRLGELPSLLLHPGQPSAD